MKDTRDLNLVEGRFGWEESFSSRMSSGIERLVDFFFPPSSFSCLCGFVCTCCACVDYGVNRLKILVLCLFFVFEGAFDLLGKLMGLNLFFVFL